LLEADLCADPTAAKAPVAEERVELRQRRDRESVVDPHVFDP
jgi:hypothetical protein